MKQFNTDRLFRYLMLKNVRLCVQAIRKYRLEAAAKSAAQEKAEAGR